MFYEDDMKLIRECLEGKHAHEQRIIAEEGIRLIAKLLKKNIDYGSSVFKSPLLAPHLGSGFAIRVRMSDKIERLMKLLKDMTKPKVTESVEDTIDDLAGYSILLRVDGILQREMTSVQVTDAGLATLLQHKDQRP